MHHVCPLVGVWCGKVTSPKKKASWKIDKGKGEGKESGWGRAKCSLWALQNSAGGRCWTVEKGDRKRSRVTLLYTVTRKKRRVGWVEWWT